jgi:prolyl 4-hydroxylase
MDNADTQALVQRARSGDPAAQEGVADLLAQAGEGEQARTWLESAARAGRGSAMSRLGLWDIAGFGAPVDGSRGVDRILAGAKTGDSESMHIAAFVLGGGIAVAPDIREGLRWLFAAARSGHRRALAQLDVLSKGAAPATAASDEADWIRLAASIDLGWFGAPFRRTVYSESPHIETLAEFLPRNLCDYVIGLAGPRLQRGKIVERDGQERVSGHRSNAVMNFGLVDSDLVLELISLRTANAVGLPPENAEGLGVLHYQPGESYAPHIDYLVETPANAAQLAARGQRARTLLVYLNEGFEGGETEFPRIDKRFKPPAGSALIFHSVDASGKGDPMTVHTGRPPTRGEKWVISRWFRTKALRPAR